MENMHKMKIITSTTMNIYSEHGHIIKWCHQIEWKS